jgi:hypothetical protein
MTNLYIYIYIKHPVAEPGYLVFLVEETLKIYSGKKLLGF